MKAKDLYILAEKCFEKRSGVVALFQELADNFYPERADFTASREMGESFASSLMTSYPILVRRDLGDAFDTMLRPTGKEWFHMGVQDEEFNGDNEARRWLQETAQIMRRAMMDRITGFHRATKEGDHDFATFGNAVIQVETVKERPDVGPHLLYRCWHLRDVAWRLAKYGEVGSVFRKWKPCLRDLVGLYKDVHPQVTKEAAKDPYAEIKCMHLMVEADMYDGEYLGRKMNMPYVSIHYDCVHDHVMEAVGKWSREYVVPRWKTLGQEYAVSPAAITALPDARLLQAMTRTLLEAGEMAVKPPLVGKAGALRSDMQLFAGGFTAVDQDYDERLGPALRPLIEGDKSGIPLGIDMQRDSRSMLAEAWYISKISPPLLTSDPRMTAFQAGQIVQQYIRQATPLFTPVETEYNGGLCEETYEQIFGSMIRMEARVSGSTPLKIPRSLRGADIQFRFESPLHDAIERQKVGQFMEGKAVLAEAIAMDPNLAAIPDGKTALRDILQAVWPAKWLRSESQVEAMEQEAAALKQSQQQLAVVQQGAEAAKTISEAASNLAPVA